MTIPAAVAADKPNQILCMQSSYTIPYCLPFDPTFNDNDLFVSCGSRGRNSAVTQTGREDETEWANPV